WANPAWWPRRRPPAWRRRQAGPGHGRTAAGRQAPPKPARGESGDETSWGGLRGGRGVFCGRVGRLGATGTGAIIAAAAEHVLADHLHQVDGGLGVDQL